MTPRRWWIDDRWRQWRMMVAHGTYVRGFTFFPWWASQYCDDAIMPVVIWIDRRNT